MLPVLVGSVAQPETANALASAEMIAIFRDRRIIMVGPESVCSLKGLLSFSNNLLTLMES